MGATPKYMGYVMAGYALGGIISAPLYGYIGLFIYLKYRLNSIINDLNYEYGPYCMDIEVNDNSG